MSWSWSISIKQVIFTTLILPLLTHSETRDCSINSTTDLDPFQETILKLHNAARAKHEDTAPLCWSPSIASDAQTHADWLTDPSKNPTGELRNSDYTIMISTFEGSGNQVEQIHRYGENLLKGSIVLSLPPPAQIASSAVSQWYTQQTKYNYNFDLGGFSVSTKEFTQLIWRASREVGCAYSVRDARFYVVVCMYTPEGNKGTKSDYHHNVNKKISCDPPVIPHSTHLDPGPFVISQHLTLQCEPGYTLDGSSSGACLRDRTWQFKTFPSCKGCKVEAMSNGTTDVPVGNVVLDQSSVIYTCSEGYNLDDSPRVLQCNGNNFSHPIPRCRKEGHCLRPLIKDGIAYSRAVDDDPSHRIGDQWVQNIPEGHSIKIICQEGYEVVGNVTAICRGKQYDVAIATCYPSETEGRLASAQTITLTTKLLLLSLVYHILLKDT